MRSTPVGRWAVATAAALAGLVATTVPAAAAPDPGSPAPAPAPAPVAPAPAVGVGLSPEVAAVPATSPELDRAQADRGALARRLERDSRDLSTTTSQLEDAGTLRVATGGLLLRRQAELGKATEEHDRLRTDLRTLATEWFVNGFGAEAQLDPTLDARQLGRLDRRRVLAESAAEDTLHDLRFVARRMDGLAGDVRDLTGRNADLDRTVADLGARRDRLAGDVERGTAELALADARVATERLNATVVGTDLSTIALDAYWRAARRLALEAPRCGVTWWEIAGIGRTESGHGTYRGSRVGVDGRVTEPILGPPLDGSNGFAVLRDSDGGLLDGTATTDRAVGPMQFLPSTWRTMARDATGDGVADPQNLYDAALAAGAYLCRSGPLPDDAALRRAYLTYNRSQVYVDTVVGHAEGYRAAVPLA